MDATFTLTGSLLATPLTSAASNAVLPIPIDEIMALSKKLYDEYTLEDNDVIDVSLGGLSEVNILYARATGGKVRMRITSADGALAEVPVDPLGLVLSQSVGITAIDLMRDNALTTPVQVVIFLGQKA